jgi:hypothetical protein
MGGACSMTVKCDVKCMQRTWMRQSVNVEMSLKVIHDIVTYCSCT